MDDQVSNADHKCSSGYSSKAPFYLAFEMDGNSKPQSVNGPRSKLTLSPFVLATNPFSVDSSNDSQ
jgi:hypothetical protein